MVLNPLERFIGLERSAFDQNEVFAIVKDTGILEPVSAELIESESGLILSIEVEELWAIFPLPFVMASSGEVNFGLFFLDTNAFGMRDIVAIGGAYGTYGWSAMAMYNHTPRHHGLPGWNGFFMYGRQEREAVDRDDNIYRRYAANQLRFSLGLNYLFFDLVTGAISLSYSDISLRNIDDVLNAPEQGAAHIGINPAISMRHSSWDGYFLSQRSVSFEYSYYHAITGSSFHELEFRGNYEQSLVPGFRFTARSGAVWKSTSDTLFEEGPRNAQVDILPRNYTARHYAGLSTGLEKYLFGFRFGTLSAIGLWQGVFSYTSDLEFNHGPSGGFLVYFSRVAIPAIGISLAYNMNSGLYQFNFVVGMSF